MAPVSIEFNPVDLVIDEVKKLVISLWNGSSAPRVAGLFHSATATPRAPPTSKTRLAQSTILEFSDHCLGIL